MNQRQRESATQESVDERIAQLSARRFGIFSRSEAVHVGATRGLIERRLATKRWEGVALGVYRLSGVPDSWRQRLLIACLAAGESAVGSHRSAGALRRLSGIEKGAPEITVPRWRRRQPAGAIVHEGVLPAVDVEVFEAIPVTTSTRTLVDLGAVISPDALEEALDDALRRRLTTVSRLRWRVDSLAGPGRRGIATIRSLLDARAPAETTPQSVLETRFARLLRRAGLPAPVRQHQIREHGMLLAVVDFAYPDRLLAIEVDGYRWHSGRAPWQRDLARRNRLTSRGWLVIHVTAEDIEQRPDELVWMVAAALAQPSTR